MRDLRSPLYPPGLDLEPIPVALVDHLVVQSINSGILIHALSHQLLIKFARSVSDPFIRQFSHLVFAR